MMILQTIHGNPVTTIRGICEQFSISDRTARTVVKEMEEERKRYGDFAIFGEEKMRRINFLAFTDYWRFRKMLRDKNARKHVPPYEPQEVARALGFYGGGESDGTD